MLFKDGSLLFPTNKLFDVTYQNNFLEVKGKSTVTASQIKGSYSLKAIFTAKKNNDPGVTKILTIDFKIGDGTSCVSVDPCLSTTITAMSRQT